MPVDGQERGASRLSVGMSEKGVVVHRAHLSSRRAGVRSRRARGAALVEFALVLPLLLTMLLGIVTSGSAYNRKLQMSHAVREGARYGATASPMQSWTSGTWASNVQALVVQRSAGDLTNASVCVSLVVNTSTTNTTVYSDATHAASFFTTKTDGTPCFTESYAQYSTNDNGLRVQVRSTRGEKIELGLLPAVNVTLVSSATAKLEKAV
jgi:Flp pilus assembly protein TadG